MKIVLIIIIILLSNKFLSAQVTQEYQNEIGNYSTLFFGQQHDSILYIDSELGEMILKMHMSYNDDQFYAVSYFDYPENIDFISIDSILNNSLHGGINSMNGKLLSKVDISYNQYKGKRARITLLNNRKLAEIRLYLIGKRQYQQLLICNPEAIDSFNSYLDSFKLLNENLKTEIELMLDKLGYEYYKDEDGYIFITLKMVDNRSQQLMIKSYKIKQIPNTIYKIISPVVLIDKHNPKIDFQALLLESENYDLGNYEISEYNNESNVIFIVENYIGNIDKKILEKCITIISSKADLKEKELTDNDEF